METQYKFAQNGQELQQADVNLISKNASLADDRTLAEILRIAPYNGTVSKLILPYGYQGVASGATGIVQSAGATGKIRIFPFRAIVGSRDTIAGIGLRENFRDIRSAVFNTDDGSGNPQTILLAANSSGNPRWDLVYAIVSIEQPLASLSRYIKDPVSKSVSSGSVASNIATTVTVSVVTGTPGASPDPTGTTLPTDGGSTYYIPIAYVRVPNGFSGISTVGHQDILTVTPVAGASGLRPANHQYKPDGTALTSARAGSWASSGTRPSYFIPSEMTGTESRVVFMGLADPSSANWSHLDATVVDDSIDWRNRFFKVTCKLNSTNVPSVWSTGVASGSVPRSGQALVTDLGQSIYDDLSSFYTTTNHGGVVCYFDHSSNTVIASTMGLGLYVDQTTGALMALINGAPAVNAFFWVEATAAYPNK